MPIKDGPGLETRAVVLSIALPERFWEYIETLPEDFTDWCVELIQWKLGLLYAMINSPEAAEKMIAHDKNQAERLMEYARKQEAQK